MTKQHLAVSNSRLVNGDFSLKLPWSLSLSTGRNNSGGPCVNLPYPGWQTAVDSTRYHYSSTLPSDVIGYNERRCNWLRCTSLIPALGVCAEEDYIPLTAFLPTDNIMDLIGKRVTLRFLFAAEEVGQYSVTIADGHFCSSVVIPFNITKAKTVTEQVVSFILPENLRASFAYPNTYGEHGLLISFCAAIGNNPDSRASARTTTWNSNGALGHYTDYRFDLEKKWVAFAEVEFYEGMYREYIAKSSYETEQDCAPFYLAEFGDQVCHGGYINGTPRGFIEHGGNLSTNAPVALYRGNTGWIKGISSNTEGTCDTITFTPMVTPPAGTGVFKVNAVPVIGSYVDPIVFISFQQTVRNRVLQRQWAGRPEFDVNVDIVQGINTGDSSLAMASSAYTLDNKCENGNFAMLGLAPYASNTSITTDSVTSGYLKHWDIYNKIADCVLSVNATPFTCTLDTTQGELGIRGGWSSDNDTYKDEASLVYTFKDRELEPYLGQIMVLTFTVKDWSTPLSNYTLEIPVTLVYPDGRTGTTSFIAPVVGNSDCVVLIDVPVDFYNRTTITTPASKAVGDFSYGGELRINSIQQAGSVNRMDTIRQPAISSSAPYTIASGIHSNTAGFKVEKSTGDNWVAHVSSNLSAEQMIGTWKITDNVSGSYIIVTYAMRDGRPYPITTTSKPDTDQNSKWSFGEPFIEVISAADYMQANLSGFKLGNIRFGYLPKSEMDYLRILPVIENQPLARRISRNGAYYSDSKVPQRLNCSGRIIDTWDSPIHGGSSPQFTNPGKSSVIDTNEYITAIGTLSGEHKKPRRCNNNLSKLPVSVTSTAVGALSPLRWNGKVGESALGLSFYPDAASDRGFLVGSRVCTGRTTTPIFTGILNCAINVNNGKPEMRPTVALTQAWDEQGNPHLNNPVIRLFNHATNKWEAYDDTFTGFLFNEDGVILSGALADYTRDGYLLIDYHNYQSKVSGLLFAAKTVDDITTASRLVATPVISKRLLLSEVTSSAADWVDVDNITCAVTTGEAVAVTANCKLPSTIDPARIKLYCQFNSISQGNLPITLSVNGNGTVSGNTRSVTFTGIFPNGVHALSRTAPPMLSLTYAVDTNLTGARIVQSPDASNTPIDDVAAITLSVAGLHTLHGTAGSSGVPITYLWDNLSSASTRHLPSPQPPGDTNYTVVIRQGTQGAMVLSTTTKILPTAPIITKQPESGLSVYQGQSPEITIEATDFDGSPDVTFKWVYYEDGNPDKPIDGGTASHLQMATVDLIGRYNISCTVTGKNRSTISNTADLEIMSAIPTITTELQVSPITDIQGKNFTLALEFDEKETPVIRYELIVNDVVAQTKTTPGAEFTYANDNIGSYSAKVKAVNRFGSTTSDPVAFTITTATPVITKQPVSATVVKGDAVTVEMASDSYYPQTYQWFVDGSPIPDSNKAVMPITWQFTNGLSVGTHQLKATVANKYHTVTTTTVNLVVQSNQPVINSVTPASLDMFDWDTQRITISATGVHNEALTYQWYHLASNGAKTEALNGRNATLDVNGYHYGIGSHKFECVVKSTHTHYVSNTGKQIPAVIKDSRPVITVQPDSAHHTIYQGKRLVFSTTAHAVDGKRINYQWEYAPADGLQPVIGETTNTLNVINFVPGEYSLYCKIYTDTSFIYTDMVRVTILAADIKNQHTKIYINGKEVASNSWAEVGTQVKFKAFCDNPSGHPLAYSWSADSTTPITQTVEITTTVGAPNNTNYSFHDATCTITNGFATAKCAMVGVRHDSKPKIKTQPSTPPGQKWAGIAFTLSTLASSTRKDAGITDVVLKYEWFKGDVLIGTGATISHTEPARGTFKYKCRVSNQVGSTYTAEVNVGVKQLPTIAKMLWPEPKEVFIGGDTYRWFMEVNNPDDLPLQSFLFNTSNVNDESTNLTPSSTPVKLTGGRWQVSGTTVTSGQTVANHYFWMMVKTSAKPDFKLKSTAQYITFKDNHPVITTQPNTTAATIYQGTTYNLTVAARAVDGRALSYQWYNHSAAISGATATTFNCKSLAIGTHSIWCRISTSRTHTDSHSAAVTVKSSAMTNARITMTSNGAAVASASYVPIGATLVATAHVTNPSGLPLTYKWTVDGPYTTSGNTVTCKAITPTTNFNSDFACVIDNGPGSVTAPPCHVRPDSAPSVRKQVPATLPDATPGQTVNAHFYVSTVRSLITGHEPMPNVTYTWYEGNPGDTSKVIQAARSINVTTPNLGGNLGSKPCYDCALSVVLTGAGVVKKLWCRITTLFGHCDSAACSVRVGYPAPTWITQPNMGGLTARQGATVSFAGKGNPNGAPAGVYRLIEKWASTAAGPFVHQQTYTNNTGNFSIKVNSPRLGVYEFEYTYTTDGGSIAASRKKLVTMVSGSPTTDLVVTQVGELAKKYQYENFTFTFLVNDPINPISYQWYKGAPGDLSTPLSGKTGSSLTTYEPNAGNAHYWCRASNKWGSLNSNAGKINIWYANPTVTVVAPVGGYTGNPLTIGTKIKRVTDAVAGNFSMVLTVKDPAGQVQTIRDNGPLNSTGAVINKTMSFTRHGNHLIKVEVSCDKAHVPVVTKTGSFQVQASFSIATQPVAASSYNQGDTIYVEGTCNNPSGLPVTATLHNATTGAVIPGATVIGNVRFKTPALPSSSVGLTPYYFKLSAGGVTVQSSTFTINVTALTFTIGTDLNDQRVWEGAQLTYTVVPSGPSANVYQNISEYRPYNSTGAWKPLLTGAWIPGTTAQGNSSIPPGYYERRMRIRNQVGHEVVSRTGHTYIKGPWESDMTVSNYGDSFSASSTTVKLSGHLRPNMIRDTITSIEYEWADTGRLQRYSITIRCDNARWPSAKVNINGRMLLRDVPRLNATTYHIDSTGTPLDPSDFDSHDKENHIYFTLYDGDTKASEAAVKFTTQPAARSVVQGAPLPLTATIINPGCLPIAGGLYSAKDNTKLGDITISQIDASSHQSITVVDSYRPGNTGDVGYYIGITLPSGKVIKSNAVICNIKRLTFTVVSQGGTVWCTPIQDGYPSVTMTGDAANLYSCRVVAEANVRNRDGLVVKKYTEWTDPSSEKFVQIPVGTALRTGEWTARIEVKNQTGYSESTDRFTIAVDGEVFANLIVSPTTLAEALKIRYINTSSVFTQRACTSATSKIKDDVRNIVYTWRGTDRPAKTSMYVNVTSASRPYCWIYFAGDGMFSAKLTRLSPTQYGVVATDLSHNVPAHIFYEKGSIAFTLYAEEK